MKSLMYATAELMLTELYSKLEGILLAHPLREKVMAINMPSSFIPAYPARSHTVYYITWLRERQVAISSMLVVLSDPHALMRYSDLSQSLS